MYVKGIKGRTLALPILKPQNFSVMCDFICTSQRGGKLVGKDLLGALGIFIQLKNSRTEVNMWTIKESELQQINLLWAGEKDRGKLNILLFQLFKRSGEVVKKKQYSVPVKGRRGLNPITDQLIKDGLLEREGMYEPISCSSSEKGIYGSRLCKCHTRNCNGLSPLWII